MATSPIRHCFHLNGAENMGVLSALRLSGVFLNLFPLSAALTFVSANYFLY